MGDMVNHPEHYNKHPSGVECIDVVEHMAFNTGNAVKYIWRADHKEDAVQDLRKAIWYLEREIARRAKALEEAAKAQLPDPRPSSMLRNVEFEYEENANLYTAIVNIPEGADVVPTSTGPTVSGIRRPYMGCHVCGAVTRHLMFCKFYRGPVTHDVTPLRYGNYKCSCGERFSTNVKHVVCPKASVTWRGPREEEELFT